MTATLAAPDLEAQSFRRRHFAGTRGLATNGGALVVNVLASGATGLVFWVLAARLAAPTVVAEASTLIAAIIAVVSLTQQSIVFTLPAMLAVSPRPQRLVRGSYAGALAITAVVAPLYAAIGPSFAGGLLFMRDRRLGAAFVAGCLVWCLFSLQDAVLTGVRKTTLVLVENTTWGLVRLALLVGVWALGADVGVGWLAASWIAPALMLVGAVSWYLFLSDRSPLTEPLGTQEFDRRRLISFLGAEYLASVLSSIVTLVAYAYALTVLGASAAAPFLTAASLVVVVEGALASFAQALAVEASRSDGDRRRSRNLLRLTALCLGGCSLAAIVIGSLAGHWVMGLLGAHYRGSGGTALAILMLALPARSISVVSNADNRVRGEGGRNLVQQVVACVVLFGLLLTGRIDTVVSLSWAVVAMRVVPAVLAAFHLRAGRLRLPVAT